MIQGKKNRIFLANASIVILIAILFFNNSCEYEVTEIYKRDLDDNVTAPTIDVVSLDLSEEKDTIELLFNRVYFHFTSSNQSIKTVAFYINDTLVGQVNSKSGYYDLNHVFLYNGYQKLRLEIITNSGTGSIAESLGLEGYIFQTKEWVINVLATQYTNVTSNIDNGYLKLRWPKSTFNISEYIIYHSGNEIGRTKENEFIYKGYIGEGGEFKVSYIGNSSGNIINYGWVDMPVELEIQYSADKENNYYIEWNKPKYYAAIDSLLLYTSSNEGDTRESLSNFMSQKHKITEALFGSSKEYWYTYRPKYYNPVFDKSLDPGHNYKFPHSSKINCLTGYPSPYFLYSGRINSTDILYHQSQYKSGSLLTHDSLFRYSTTDNKILSSYMYNPPDYTSSALHYRNLSISPDGKHLSATIGDTRTIMYCATDDFSDFTILENDNLISPSISGKTPITNDGTGLIYPSKSLYNFKNNYLLDQIEDATALSNYNVSFDGSFLFLRVSHTIWLYSIEDDTISSNSVIYNLSPTTYDYFDFHNTESDIVVTWGEETGLFCLRNCPDMSIIKSFPIPDELICDIDYFNNRILSFSLNQLNVRDLEDGELLYTIPIDPYAQKKKFCKTYGNSIFYPGGVRYYLN